VYKLLDLADSSDRLNSSEVNIGCMVEARSAEKIREIIEMIEHSQLPLVDSKFFSAIRAKIAANQPIDDQEYDRLVRLAGNAGKASPIVLISFPPCFWKIGRSIFRWLSRT